MIRNLKFAAIAAAVAVMAALGVTSISGADTAEFHCSVEPCSITAKPDGTGTTAHHVIDLYGGGGGSFSTTCSTVTGEATAKGKAFSEITVTNIVGSGCSVLGQSAELKMNGCDYLLKSAGTLTISCPVGKEIEAGTKSACLYFIPAQGPLKGVSFHNVGVGEVTVEMAINEIMATASNCGGISGTVNAQFTTGNTLLTAETDPGGFKASLSFA